MMNTRNYRILFASVALFVVTAWVNSSFAQTAVQPPKEINDLLQKYTCLACHKADARLVGPAYVDVAKKKYTNDKIVELIYKPQPGNWPGYPPMAPMTQVPKADALKIAGWINSLNKPAAAPKKKS
ncbi:cytochrome C [Xanthocytophaga agilis]|uniref:Cytochrome C n=1 Tax=Xanthocytophaga agilis TaxID=3048010 RepID=A0AAE3R2H4_9BACT|nr:cytochrome C [Xanthocytophaga agilis]MDJ1500109.1 cytochrome C [Xanthocytophaga agilis]